VRERKKVKKGKNDMKEKLTGTVINPDVVRGKSAYEIAVMNGFDGTEEEWLYSLAEEANTIAKAYADNAGASAQRAEEAKASAETAETNAQGSAKSATESASAASASAIRHAQRKLRRTAGSSLKGS
jgi:hypothetical protein